MAQLEDVRGRYEFRVTMLHGKTYKQAWGWLGMPDQVEEHRSSGAQKQVAGGTGDDAGHLIGNRFGSPGGVENLSLQNWKQNRYGTYKDLENAWAGKRRTGIEIWVQVTDISRPGELRPFMRNVQWKELVNGVETPHEVIFANPHTQESREKQQIPQTAVEGRCGNVIPVDFKLQKRL